MISDSDFQQLVRHDLRTIITRKPEMKSAIVNAYQYALPEGQQFVRDALKELDPEFVVEPATKTIAANKDGEFELDQT